jgi:ribosomal protein L37AE/L43A
MKHETTKRPCPLCPEDQGCTLTADLDTGRWCCSECHAHGADPADLHAACHSQTRTKSLAELEG